MSSGKILVANETFSITRNGAPVFFRKGKTTVRAGHSIIEGLEDKFDPIKVEYDNDVEQATARPGEKRRGRRATKTAEETAGDGGELADDAQSTEEPKDSEETAGDKK